MRALKVCRKLVKMGLKIRQLITVLRDSKDRLNNESNPEEHAI
jgi:hypothetical protein